jgi:hypothetical protein
MYVDHWRKLRKITRLHFMQTHFVVILYILQIWHFTTHIFLRYMPYSTFLFKKMRCIPNLYVAWVRSKATLALPDVVYDCHHQVAYVSCIVAYVRLSELTARERASPGERIRFVFQIQCLARTPFSPSSEMCTTAWISIQIGRWSVL